MKALQFLALALVLAWNTHLCAAVLTQHPHTAGKAPEGLAKSDWTSIRAAYEAGRHAIQAVEGGWEARNLGQQWVTRFDGRGFVVEPSDGGWQWGLELQSYGFQGCERAVGGSAAVQADGQKLTYTWDAEVQEWFVNDGRGVEHGFTVFERPAENPALNSQSSALSFLLSVRGDLVAAVTAGGQGVKFCDGSGKSVLNYTGLKVWDADGKTLPAHFAPAEAGVRLVVDERGSRYPITVDPIAQQAYLKASNTGLDDYFGDTVAVSGDTVVVGSHWENGSGTGVNPASNDEASAAGAAYVFVRNGTNWSQQAYLKASNTGAGDWFGISVAVTGDTIVIGASREDGSGTGVNPISNELASGAGAAYVFVRSGTTWSQQAYLKASNTGANDSFGYAVAVSGDTIVVGAGGADVGGRINAGGGATFLCAMVRTGASRHSFSARTTKPAIVSALRWLCPETPLLSGLLMRTATVTG